jgi:hypothetical protein
MHPKLPRPFIQIDKQIVEVELRNGRRQLNRIFVYCTLRYDLGGCS